MKTALALSPHLDDAAFSCGGSLAMLARAGWRVTLATLFTRSVPSPQGFSLACQLDKGLGPDVDYMALRRREDVMAARALGIEPPRHLPLAEAPHRGYNSAKALFGPLLPDDDAAARVTEVVAALLTELAPALVLAPQAIGGHVDHVQVVQALEGLAAPILWWQDFPYTVRHPNPVQPFATRFASLPQRTVALDAEALAAKARACAAYASQIGFQFGGEAGLASRLAETGATEVFRGSPPLDISA